MRKVLDRNYKRIVGLRPADLLRAIPAIVIVCALATLVPTDVDAEDTVSRATPAGQDTAETTVAIRVKNETYPMKAFQRRVEKLFKAAKKQAKKKKKKFKPQKVRSQIRNKIKRRVLTRLIVDHHAKKAGVTVSDTRIKRQLLGRFKMAGGRKKYLKKIEKQGRTIEQIKKAIRDKVRRKSYVRQNIDVTVTDTDIRKVYENRKDDLGNVNKQRAYKFLRKRIRKTKENLESKKFIAELKKKTDIQINL